MRLNLRTDPLNHANWELHQGHRQSTDRLREQTKFGQLKARVHQRLHRPKWHTTNQLKCRVVRTPMALQPDRENPC